jgi:hypothetical protein
MTPLSACGTPDQAIVVNTAVYYREGSRTRCETPLYGCTKLARLVRTAKKNAALCRLIGHCPVQYDYMHDI